MHRNDREFVEIVPIFIVGLIILSFRIFCLYKINQSGTTELGQIFWAIFFVARFPVKLNSKT